MIFALMLLLANVPQIQQRTNDALAWKASPASVRAFVDDSLNNCFSFTQIIPGFAPVVLRAPGQTGTIEIRMVDRATPNFNVHGLTLNIKGYGWAVTEDAVYSPEFPPDRRLRVTNGRFSECK